MESIEYYNNLNVYEDLNIYRNYISSLYKNFNELSYVRQLAIIKDLMY